MEMIFSCRALGRDIESVAFACLLQKLSIQGIEQLTIDVQEGPRNAPAHLWLKRYVVERPDNIAIADLLQLVQLDCHHHPSKVEVIDHE